MSCATCHLSPVTCHLPLMDWCQKGGLQSSDRIFRKWWVSMTATSCCKELKWLQEVFHLLAYLLRTPGSSCGGQVPPRKYSSSSQMLPSTFHPSQMLDAFKYSSSGLYGDWGDRRKEYFSAVIVLDRQLAWLHRTTNTTTQLLTDPV